MAAIMGENTRVGFVGSVLSGQDIGGVNDCLCSEALAEVENERILLLSNLEISPSSTQINNKQKIKKKRPRTTNRKRVSLSETITHDGTVYGINNKASYGVYLRLLHKIISQLDICIVKWKRVFVIRFDLHQHWHTDKNTMVSKFRKNLLERIGRAYGVYEVGYVWVREQEKVKQQHYHFALFLDGDKINHSAKISEIIRDTWESVKVGNTAHIPIKCYYNVVDYESKADAVFRISYFAKQRGKGYRPNQTKDYGTSRLLLPASVRFGVNDLLWIIASYYALACIGFPTLSGLTGIA